MNKRDYKQFNPDSIHHVFNRGTAKADIFYDKADYLLFLDRLLENIYPRRYIFQRSEYGYRRKVLPEGAFDLMCYCLMPNHFHLLIRQNKDIPISKLISKVCTSYVKYFNRKYNRVGVLFQDQFKSVEISSDHHLKTVIDYIHLNPVKSDLVKDSREYEFCCKLGINGHLREDAHLWEYAKINPL